MSAGPPSIARVIDEDFVEFASQRGQLVDVVDACMALLGHGLEFHSKSYIAACGGRAKSQQSCYKDAIGNVVTLVMSTPPVPQ